MPLSSQIEYHRLINRISLLEKKKLTKLKIYTPTEAPTQAISVTITNDHITVKPLKNTNRIISSKPPVDSLVKQVLVKNIAKNQKIDSKELLVNLPSNSIKQTALKGESTNQQKKTQVPATDISKPTLNIELKRNSIEAASVVKTSISEVVPANVTVQEKSNKTLKQINTVDVAALSDSEKTKVLSQTEIQYAAHR